MDELYLQKKGMAFAVDLLLETQGDMLDLNWSFRERKGKKKYG